MGLSAYRAVDSPIAVETSRCAQFFCGLFFSIVRREYGIQHALRKTAFSTEKMSVRCCSFHEGMVHWTVQPNVLTVQQM